MRPTACALLLEHALDWLRIERLTALVEVAKFLKLRSDLA
jgi:hypothetical protein